jgi:hypothetical protein
MMILVTGGAGRFQLEISMGSQLSTCLDDGQAGKAHREQST